MQTKTYDENFCIFCSIIDIFTIFTYLCSNSIIFPYCTLKSQATELGVTKHTIRIFTKNQTDSYNRYSKLEKVHPQRKSVS